MKKFAFTLLLTLAVLSMSAQHRADRQKLTDENSSTMILLGDPQGYTKYDVNNPLLGLQMCWIHDNIDQLNIKAVLCVGDLVEQNDYTYMDRRMVNQTSRQMWETVSKAYEWIDGEVPYMSSPGNHDYGYRSSENERTYYPDYFNPERQGKVLTDCLVAQYPNREGRSSMENAAFEFELPGWDRKVLVITSEFAPSDGAVNWAKDLCFSKKFMNHVVIYVTHSYMRCHLCNNTRIGREAYPLTKKDGNNSGEQLWEKLFSQVPNIRLVLCGHHGHGPEEKTKADEFWKNVGWRTDPNTAGYNVHQMMFNVQTLGGGWEGNGGDCWLRILEFMPDGKTVKVRTYSPLFGISPSTRHLAHRSKSYDQFDFVIE